MRLDFIPQANLQIFPLAKYAKIAKRINPLRALRETIFMRMPSLIKKTKDTKDENPPSSPLYYS